MVSKRSIIAWSLLILLLLASWLLLFAMVSVATWGLTPYDTTPLELRPEPGTWAREINDFFLTGAARYLPAILVVGTGMSLFARTWSRTPPVAHLRTKQSVRFCALNLIAVLGMSLGVIAVAELPLELAPYPGFGWTCKFLAVDCLVLGLLIYWQARWSNGQALALER
jgi:hypothetical protein